AAVEEDADIRVPVEPREREIQHLRARDHPAEVNAVVGEDLVYHLFACAPARCKVDQGRAVHGQETAGPRVAPGIDEHHIPVAVLEHLVSPNYHVLALAKLKLAPGENHEVVRQELAAPRAV